MITPKNNIEWRALNDACKMLTKARREVIRVREDEVNLYPWRKTPKKIELHFK